MTTKFVQRILNLSVLLTMAREDERLTSQVRSGTVPPGPSGLSNELGIHRFKRERRFPLDNDLCFQVRLACCSLSSWTPNPPPPPTSSTHHRLQPYFHSVRLLDQTPFASPPPNYSTEDTKSIEKEFRPTMGCTNTRPTRFLSIPRPERITGKR